MLGSWQRYLAGEPKDDPVFRVFLGLGSVPDAEFAAKAPAVLAEATQGRRPTRRVAAAFAKAADDVPGRVRDLRASC